VVALAVVLSLHCAVIAGPVDLTFLHTSDVHGHIANWDYFADREADLGLTLVAGIVREERKADPQLLLLDGGDTIQGTPLVYHYNVERPRSRNPMAVIMNAMRYDAMVIGNHEYDFGQTVLNKFIEEAEFPVLCANVSWTGGGSPYTRYTVRTVKGIPVGILGLITPGVPSWEPAANIRGLVFRDAVETATELVPRLLDRGAEVVLVLAHSGLYDKKRHASGPEPASYQGEDAEAVRRDFVAHLAHTCPGIDVIFAGHTHRRVPEMSINDVLVVQPDHWGKGVSKVSVRAVPGQGVVSKKGEFISCAGRRPDLRMAALARRYHRTALRYCREPIGTATAAFGSGRAARRRDTPLVDLINAVQAELAKEAGLEVDVTAAAVFTEAAGLDAGPVDLREIYGMYQYENTMAVVEINGDIMRRAIEHSARYWQTYDPGGSNAVDRAIAAPGQWGYNWDMYSGIEYDVDISKPVGERVTELKMDGKPLAADRRFRIAINSYRAAGGGGYVMYKEGKRLWESAISIRTAIENHLRRKKTISPADYFVRNWRLLPSGLPE